MQNANGFEIEVFNQYSLKENAKYSTCPLCSEHRKKKDDKCAQLHWETGLGYCHHCGERFQLHTYKKRSVERKINWRKPDMKPISKYSEGVLNWFNKRGISKGTLEFMKVGEGFEFMPQVNKKMNCIQFNYFRDGELINIKYRDGEKRFKLEKDAELILYNLDSIKMCDSVVIVEGEIDALSYIEAGVQNVVSVPNGATLGNVNLQYLDNSIEYFENKKKIYLALDNDEAGKNLSKELTRRFIGKICFLVDFRDKKDANEYLVSYGKESLLKTISEAKDIPIEGTSSLNDWREAFDDYLLNGAKGGYITGIKSFDNVFSTYTGQYIVVTGIPSSGKSDFVDEMCIGYYKEYGWKTAYASPENKPNYIHAGKLLAKFVGKWVNTQEQIDHVSTKLAKIALDDTFKFIDLEKYSLEEVLAKCEQLIFKYGIKVLVIDPYNKVKLKSSDEGNLNKYTNDYLLTLDEFARKHDILILLVAHPTKPSRGEGKSYEPTFYDIKGGGEFYDMSPHGLLVHRDYEKELTKVKVLKVKFSHLGENNAHVWLKWNKANGRYSDFNLQNSDGTMLGEPNVDNTNWFDFTKKEDIKTLPEADWLNVTEKTSFGKMRTQINPDDLPF